MKAQETKLPVKPGAEHHGYDEASASRVRHAAELLDTYFEIPGLGIKIGLDGIIGLVPGWGDLISMLLSLYIVFEASRAGVPGAILLRMLGNIVLDSAIGAIPLLGDLFDIAFKSNARNAALLMRWVESPTETRAKSRAWVALMFLVVAVVLVSIAYVAVKVGAWFVGLVSAVLS